MSGTDGQFIFGIVDSPYFSRKTVQVSNRKSVKLKIFDEKIIKLVVNKGIVFEKSFWEEKKVTVTGGASFIGSAIVDDLVNLGAQVDVIDNFSSGTMSNLEESKDKVKIHKFDIELSPRDELVRLLKDTEIVFHLAARHGGRGYIDSHPADVCNNMAIDNIMLNASLSAGVEKVIAASSACVYPPSLQDKTTDYMLQETDTDVTKLEDYLSADIEYGWAKVMGEMQLRAFNKQYGLKGASMRFVTAYGPRENETHAIIALIYKALNHQEPFEIWGDGNQDRDFTYVKDISSACILAGEKATIDEFNVGTGERYRIIDIANSIFDYLQWKPREIFFNRSRPTGVYSRALNIEKIKKVLGWQPEFSLRKGMEETIEWYKRHGNLTGISENLLLERKVSKESSL